MRINELLDEHICKTPGAMFNSKIKDNLVSVDDTVPDAKKAWEKAKKKDLHESINKDQILTLLRRNFVVKGKIDIDDDGYVSVLREGVPFVSVKMKPKKFSQLPVKFTKIEGLFECDTISLTTLNGGPSIVNGSFKCMNNNLSNLLGSPEEVYGSYDCFDNPLESLDGLPKIIRGYISFNYNSKLPLLKILLVKGLTGIIMLDRNVYPPNEIDHRLIVETILTKYIGKGRGGALQCAAELIKAGYRDNAKL